MGGAVSSGKDNSELIDNLVCGNYIRSTHVVRAFRAVDRADYMTPESRDEAYKDLAWRNGPLHLSAPCIYSEVMEGLELRPGLSFLNIGSGTGYLSTLVGLVLGGSGISHGVEVHPMVVDYAKTKINQFMENSPVLDEFEFCEPKFYHGNGLCLSPLQVPYDRVYCGAGVPIEYLPYFKQLIKVGGVLVMPLQDHLLQIRRLNVLKYSSRSLLSVSFASLRLPTKDDADELIKLDEQCPGRLQALARAAIRHHVRLSLYSRQPELYEPPKRPRAAPSCPRRLCLPLQDDSDIENLNELHDLSRADGAGEMNALLDLVLTMGRQPSTGALRWGPLITLDRLIGQEGGNGNADGDNANNVSNDNGNDRDNGENEEQDGTDGDNGTDNENGTDEADGDDDDDDNDGTDEDDVRYFINSLRGNINRTLMSDEDMSDVSSPDNGGVDPESWPPAPRYSFKLRNNSMPHVHQESPGVQTRAQRAAARARLRDSDDSLPSKSKKDQSSEEDTEEVSLEQKRVKLDSGMGEDNSPTGSGSPPAKHSDESGVEAGSDSPGPSGSGRLRMQKRSRKHMDNRSSSTERDSETSDLAQDGMARCKRRAGPLGPEGRRARLSLLMRRAVGDLPLPLALKTYVNFGRPFEV